MKRLVMTLALTGVLSISVMAGDIPTTDSPAPAPGGTTNATSTTSPGQIPSAPGDIPTSDAAQPVFDAALSAFLSVFGLVV